MITSTISIRMKEQPRPPQVSQEHPPRSQQRPPQVSQPRPPQASQEGSPRTPPRSPQVFQERPPQVSQPRPPQASQEGSPQVSQEGSPRTPPRSPQVFQERPPRSQQRPPQASQERPPQASQERPPQASQPRPPQVSQEGSPRTPPRSPQVFQERPPRSQQRPPQVSQPRPPQASQEGSPQVSQEGSPRTPPRSPQVFQERPPRSQQRPPQASQERPPQASQPRPPQVSQEGSPRTPPRSPQVFQERPPRSQQRPPQASQEGSPRTPPRSPQVSQERPPQASQEGSPRTPPRSPQVFQERPPRSQQRSPQVSQERPPQASQERPPRSQQRPPQASQEGSPQVSQEGSPRTPPRSPQVFQPRPPRSQQRPPKKRPRPYLWLEFTRFSNSDILYPDKVFRPKLYKIYKRKLKALRLRQRNRTHKRKKIYKKYKPTSIESRHPERFFSLKQCIVFSNASISPEKTKERKLLWENFKGLHSLRKWHKAIVKRKCNDLPIRRSLNLKKIIKNRVLRWRYRRKKMLYFRLAKMYDTTQLQLCFNRGFKLQSKIKFNQANVYPNIQKDFPLLNDPTSIISSLSFDSSLLWNKQVYNQILATSTGQLQLAPLLAPTTNTVVVNHPIKPPIKRHSHNHFKLSPLVIKRFYSYLCLLPSLPLWLLQFFQLVFLFSNISIGFLWINLFFSLLASNKSQALHFFFSSYHNIFFQREFNLHSSMVNSSLYNSFIHDSYRFLFNRRLNLNDLDRRVVYRRRLWRAIRRPWKRYSDKAFHIYRKHPSFYKKLKFLSFEYNYSKRFISTPKLMLCNLNLLRRCKPLLSIKK